MKNPYIAFVSATRDKPVPANFHKFSNTDELLDHPEVDIVLLDQASDQAARAVSMLRAQPAFHFNLIFTRDSKIPLCDGEIPDDPESLIPVFRLWLERMSMFNQGQSPDRFEERVLAWLWTRPATRLEPALNPDTRELYQYPLLEVMAGQEPINAMLWLNLMTEQGWLERGELLDRIRLCNRCSSGRLNYVDVCPDCQALDIAKQPSLHCFTCGHVAPQEHFLKSSLLICPNCMSRLRHIGSDYDRPLENFRCLSCQSFFVDADVEARCLECGEHHEPNELKICEIRPYHLSERGRLRCRQGFSDQSVAEAFGRLNLIAVPTFSTLLNWEIQQARRYKTMQPCSLLLMRMEALEKLSGYSEGLAIVDSLVDRIQEAIRDTDRCTRTREDLLWFLLPHTDRQGMEVLRSRLSELSELYKPQQSDWQTEIRLAGYTLPEDLLTQEDGDLLMARLTGEVS